MKQAKTLAYLLLAVSCSRRIECTTTAGARQGRSLTFPAPSQLFFILGLGTPLQLERESVIVGAFSKFIYNLPTNASQLEPGRASAGEEVSLRPVESRWSLYRRLARLAEVYGFAEGRACVLRAICESASAPFGAHLGLLHQLLQLFFSQGDYRPSSTDPEPYDEYQDQQYEAAEQLGTREPDACRGRFQSDCPRSFLDVFSSEHLVA